MIENNNLVIKDNIIKDRIFTIRNIQVMIDRDLAEFYGIETKVFNQAVKRNIARFPEDFKKLKHSSSLPYVLIDNYIDETTLIHLSAKANSNTNNLILEEYIC